MQEPVLATPMVVAEKYRVVRLIGEGAMGSVYEAVHSGTGKRVAIKLITGEDVDEDAEAVQRFETEARAAGAIETQHIAQVHDTGRDSATGHPYLVMEYLVGEDLSVLLERMGPLPPDVALRIVAQACMGLSKAHEANVIHRDIKPANLFVAQGEEPDEFLVKVLDFGIAKVRNDFLGEAKNRHLTRTGSLLGSPLYMSPEQARGERNVDHRTDIWSLGVVLYEALTGSTPHENTETVGALILAINTKPAESVQTRAPWIGPDVAEIVHRALARDPDKRYATAADMLAAIRSVLPEGTIRTSMVAKLTDTAKAHVAPKFVSSTMDTPPTAARSQFFEARRSLLALGAGALTAIVALTALGYRAMRNPTEDREAIDLATTSVSMAPVPAAASAPKEAPPPAPVDHGRVVQVSLLAPPLAVVEVDGSPVPVVDGSIAIRGALGSVHEVRLAAAKDHPQMVVISQDGPVPPRLAFTATKGRPSAAASIPHRPAPAVSSTENLDKTFQ